MSNHEILKKQREEYLMEVSFQQQEDILKESIDRFIVFPVKYPVQWAHYKTQEKMLWLAEEIHYQDDLNDWLYKINNDERHFLKHVLAFFASADKIVNENLMSNFAKEVQIPEARAFYAVQSYIEEVHAQTYASLIEAFIKDPAEKEHLFRAIETIPCVKKKADWAMKYMNPDTASFYRRLIAFIIMEGVFFSGAFCAIFWVASRGLLTKALGVSNQFIARDETEHTNFGIDLFKLLTKYHLPQKVVHEIFTEAIEIEIEFITVSLPVRLIGINSTEMIEYIKYTANYWLIKIGYESLYPEVVKNPFPFMILNQLEGKTNFFEKTTTEYTKMPTGRMEEINDF